MTFTLGQKSVKNLVEVPKTTEIQLGDIFAFKTQVQYVDNAAQEFVNLALGLFGQAVNTQTLERAVAVKELERAKANGVEPLFVSVRHIYPTLYEIEFQGIKRTPGTPLFLIIGIIVAVAIVLSQVAMLTWLVKVPSEALGKQVESIGKAVEKVAEKAPEVAAAGVAGLAAILVALAFMTSEKEKTKREVRA